MARLVVYQKPTCTTCRQVHAALKEQGVDFDTVDYHVDRIPRAKLVELLRKLQLPARDLVRTKEPLFKSLGLADRVMTEDDWVDALTAHPELLQRPIIEKGAKAILARPASRVAEIL